MIAQVNAGTEVDRLTDCETQANAQQPAKQPHRAGFGEEQLLHIDIAGTDGFHYPDFSPAFQHCHHQCVDDRKGRDRQRQRSENAQEQIEHGEEATQALGRIKNRKRAEAHLANRVLYSGHFSRIFHTHGERHVSFAASTAERPTHIVGLRHTEFLGRSDRKKNSST